ncbi:hypothetical protein [Nocardia crassostreae]|uniref:hypothetical protein n=1 Tax=Nocardia crassostreae TaxID=53428 RepID=UPI00083018DE|nr:hypothetical protein [Nocardia crassostreae]
MTIRTSVLLHSPFWSKPLHIPGFVRIEKVEPLEDPTWYGLSKVYVQYDTDQAATVSTVEFVAQVEPIVPTLTVPTPTDTVIPLGRVPLVGGSDRYIGYRVEVPAAQQTKRTLVVTGSLFGEVDFYVPGLVSIDEIRVVGDFFDSEIYVTYNPVADAAVEHVRVLSGDLDPIDLSRVNGVPLGRIHDAKAGWRHIHYTRTPLASGATENV